MRRDVTLLTFDRLKSDFAEAIWRQHMTSRSRVATLVNPSVNVIRTSRRCSTERADPVAEAETETEMDVEAMAADRASAPPRALSLSLSPAFSLYIILTPYSASPAV
mgnify:CR=1 FL=1